MLKLLNLAALGLIAVNLSNALPGRLFESTALELLADHFAVFGSNLLLLI